ncbi:MAG TPA: M28 family peptidase, partial [Thermoanaerobaculia bacterium]
MTRPRGRKSLRRGCWIALAAGILGIFGLSPMVGEAVPTAYDVDTALSQLGPRPDASPAQAQAQELLLAAMRQAGLHDVHAVSLPGAAGKPPQTALEGVLPGKTDQEIVLSGHYDTVARSPGADDDGSGCAVAIAAVADLARTPLSHKVRVVLFNGEEKGLLGSAAWVRALDASHRERILADLNLEMLGWTGSPGPTLHALPVRRRTGREPQGARPAGEMVLPPGWLVHAVLRSGDAVGWPLIMADPHVPLLMQLIQRSVLVRFGADSDAFQAAGIPAVTVSDSSFLSLDPTYHKATDVAASLDRHRMEQWTSAVAATVRRLDRLAGPPVAEDQYLVLGGKVWLRQHVWTLGAVLWCALVFRGIPGRWRGASAAERARQRRAYMPGYAFR